MRTYTTPEPFEEIQSDIVKEKLIKLLNGRTRKKVKENTYLRWEENGNFFLRLYDTDIVIVTNNKSIILNYGEHQSPTTKDRINWFLHDVIGSRWQIYQEKYHWYLYIMGTRYINRTSVPFYNGTVLSRCEGYAIPTYIVGYTRESENKNMDTPIVEEKKVNSLSNKNIDKAKKEADKLINCFAGDMALGKINIYHQSNDIWYSMLHANGTHVHINLGIKGLTGISNWINESSLFENPEEFRTAIRHMSNPIKDTYINSIISLNNASLIDRIKKNLIIILSKQIYPLIGVTT